VIAVLLIVVVAVVTSLGQVVLFAQVLLFGELPSLQPLDVECDAETAILGLVLDLVPPALGVERQWHVGLESFIAQSGVL